MKSIIALIICVIFLSVYSEAQIRIPGKRTIENETDKKVDEGVKGLFGKKKKDNKKDSEQDPEEAAIETESNTETTTKGEEEKSPQLKWSKYDFIPGTKVIFEDDLMYEENGEFPSRWDLVEGRVEIAEFGDENIILFFEGGSKIIPYMKDPEKDYLPESFTIEFDAWFEKGEYASYHVWFFATGKQERTHYNSYSVSGFGARADKSKGKYPGADYEWNNEDSFWRHIAISFNKRVLKIYLDEARIINIPNMEVVPTGITIACDGFGTAGVKGINRMIKNIRIAEGGVKLYQKFQEDGKIIATGLRFDSGKATIKPESMGIINKVCNMLEKYPEIKLSVEGHTDSDGDADFNMQLSTERAQAVVDAMLEKGIDADRLTYKGFGESIPIAPNDTPEGKANNRRVEFVKADE